jgi:hypothetical protein
MANVSIRGNHFESVGDNLPAVDIENGEGFVITGNRFFSGGGLRYAGSLAVIEGNFFDSIIGGPDIYIDGAAFVAVADNTHQTGGIDVQSARILVEDGVVVTVEGNVLDGFADTGIHLDGASADCVVTGNIVRQGGDDTDNTYDGITVEGDRHLIHGNMVQAAAAGNTFRYGINIASGNNNAVYANYLGDSSDYGTADSVDGGTATQVTPAAGAIGGQFAF